MDNRHHPCCENTHVHEMLGSVKLAELGSDPHNHRFATVTEKAIPCGPRDHAHEVKFRTDSYEGHYHEFCGKTTGAFPVCDGHVHYLADMTEECDEHRHEFKVATLIEDPIGD